MGCLFARHYKSYPRKCKNCGHNLDRDYYVPDGVSFWRWEYGQDGIVYCFRT